LFEPESPSLKINQYNITNSGITKILMIINVGIIQPLLLISWSLLIPTEILGISRSRLTIACIATSHFKDVSAEKKLSAFDANKLAITVNPTAINILNKKK